ncbi:M50 family metallopeptidase [Candidatus Woesearchaeota archaeon]|nr:M50 family metallopeptidase [Candidatus Woesearchaeota archaeon]
MAILTGREILDLVIMTLGVGFIFKDIFVIQPLPHKDQPYDPLIHRPSRIENLKLAILVTAPAIIFHELAHKFVALGYGLQATFHAAYGWLGIGILLKLLNTGLIFFVPGYVSHTAASMPLQNAMIAFAGPGLNLVLWIGAWILLKRKEKYSTKTFMILTLTKKINMFLFFFNMIPIGFFDGANVVEGILQYFGG